MRIGPSLTTTSGIDRSSDTLVADLARGTNEKMGSVMNMSLEFSCPLDLDTHYNTPCINFVRLVRAFESMEHPDYRNLLLAAFPGDNLAFLATFKKIVAMEKERRALLDEGDETQRYTVPDLPHAPRHDAESMYWISLWALVRALPRGAQDVLTSNYNDFCEAMLMEGSPIPGTGNRKRYLLPACVGALLHPDLRYFEGGLLEHMATYFSIPWGLYEPELGPHHAHTAMRRLLLFALLQDKPALNVELNTERVRHCNVSIFSIQTPEYPAPVSTFATMAHTFFDTTGTASQFSGLSAAASNSPLANNDEEDADAVQQTIVAQKRPASSALSRCVLTGAADPGEAPATKSAKLSITAIPRIDA